MKRLLLALLVAVSLTALGIGWLWYDYGHNALHVANAPVSVTVPKGAGAAAVALRMRESGVELDPLRFRIAARLRGDSARLKAGTYRVADGSTLQQLLDRLVAGDVVLEEIRFVEGSTFRQMRAALDAHPALAHDSRGLDDAALIERLGLPDGPAEGRFFPNTYHFSSGASDLDLLAKAAELMKQTLETAWEARAPDLPYQTPYQALILASIVEKETGRDADRPLVAAVFVNRLRRGMMLQSDPTTIYGMGERFDGNLRRRDLRADTAHNTYTRGGLPPTPISMPGKASIEAALNPASSRALYFVSRGDGTSEFSDTLDAHNRAVRKFQLRSRQSSQAARQ